MALTLIYLKVIGMKQLTQAFLASPKGRYLLVGVSVYGLELIVIMLAQRAGASSVVSVALSFWIGLIVSFGLQKFITFKDRRTHHKIFIPQVVAVSLLVLWNFGFTVLVTQSLSAVNPTVTRTIALLITTVWNFYLYKTRIFNQVAQYDKNN